MIQAITDAYGVERKNDPNVLYLVKTLVVTGCIPCYWSVQGWMFGEDRVMDTPTCRVCVLVDLQLSCTWRIPSSSRKSNSWFRLWSNGIQFLPSISFVMALPFLGTLDCSITVRSPFGGGVHTPELHADSLEGLVASTTWSKSCYPSTPYRC